MSAASQRRLEDFFGAPAKKRKVEDASDGKEEGEGSRDQSKQPDRAEINRAVALMLAKTRKVRESVLGTRQKGEQPKLKELLLEASWMDALENQFSREYFLSLERFIHSEWKGKVQIFPEPWNIFRALNACPPSKVKVVILGQDPYHNIGQAMGLSFSVPNGVQVPMSLRNIYKELKTDCGTVTPTHGNLEKWAAQGVLLLNSVLTVRAHAAGSHSKRGWETFTEEVIKTISSQQENIVFLLWGKWAQDRGRLIKNNSRHCILKCPHPSGLSAHRGFFGSKHFSQANEYLVGNKKAPIDWQL